MSEFTKKSALFEIVARHSDFDFERFVRETSPEDYDQWNGYCLPMHYSEAAREYEAIRNRCALFDASPMKKYRLQGGDAGAFLDRILTAPVSQLPAMRATYGLLCNEEGFLLDDGIVFKLSDNDYLFLITEIDHDAYFASLNDFDDIEIFEETSDWAGLAIQGPKSCAVLSQFGFSGIEALKPFDLRRYDLAAHDVIVGRVGFTGDLGYEIWFHPRAIDVIQSAINAAESGLGFEILGYGLSAVQICRIEAGMIVPGWDTAGEFVDKSRERTPYELTLGWNVKLQRDEAFAGNKP